MAGFIDPNLNQGSYGAPSNMMPRVSSMPTTTVDLTFKCSKLKDLDYISKSDPVAVIFDKINNTWREIWRSERLENNLNPIWKNKLTFDYRFEECQPIKVEIYDWDTNDKSAKGKLKDQEFIGSCETTLAAIASAPQKMFKAVLRSKSNKGAGTLSILAEEVTANKEVVSLHFAAKDLDKKDTFGKSDAFMIISMSLPMASGQANWSKVLQTKVVKNSLNPSWDSFNISLKNLCNGDYERSLKFDVYDYDSSGDNDLIGSFTTTFSKLRVGMIEKTEFKCINPKKAASKKSYKDSGKVYLKYLEVITQPSFLDYIQGGTALNFSVAIDFTGSNGDPQDPRSLHFRNQTGSNQYTQAIEAVGEIIEEYDADKQFPALGFGAKIPPHGNVSHEFFLNLTESPFCQGVQGILQAYGTSLGQVQLYGPTNFSPVINHVAKFANQYQDGRQYFVLLILTDGIITDLEETKAAIVSASALPMSIIIVGVGQEDFSAMEELDSDRGLVQAQGRAAIRDIVQFIEMRKFVINQTQWDRVALAREVLAEVPNQLVRWMTTRGVKPINA